MGVKTNFFTQIMVFFLSGHVSRYVLQLLLVRSYNWVLAKRTWEDLIILPPGLVFKNLPCMILHALLSPASWNEHDTQDDWKLYVKGNRAFLSLNPWMTMWRRDTTKSVLHLLLLQWQKTKFSCIWSILVFICLF